MAIRGIDRVPSLPAIKQHEAPKDSTLLKVAKVAGNFFEWVGAFLAALIITVTAGFYLRHVSHQRTAVAIESMAVKRQIAVKQAVARFTPEVIANSPSGGKALIDQVLKIQLLLGEEHPGSTHDHMQKVRKEINKALQLSSYQELKGDQDHPAIGFLHEAAHALTTKAEGIEEMEAYGAKALKGNTTTTGVKGLANALDYAVGRGSEFNKNTKLGKLLWAFLHPQKTLDTVLGHKKKYAASYNSYDSGNANIYIGRYLLGGVSMHFYQGPGPTGDRLFEAHLQHLENQGEGVAQLQHTLEQPWQEGEALRRKMILDMEDNHPSALRVMSTPLDGPAWKGSGDFSGDLESTEYFAALKKQIDQSNGFHLPETLLSKDEVDKAIEFSQGSFTEFEFNSEHYNSLPPERRNKVRLLAFDTLVSIRAMLNMAKGSQRELFLGQACKQGIDRGVIINVLTRLYIDGMNGVTIDDEYIKQTVGMVLLRPGMVDDRSMFMDRFEALSDMLHIIAETPEFFDDLKEFFGEESSTVSFEPAKSKGVTEEVDDLSGFTLPRGVVFEKFV